MEQKLDLRIERTYRSLHQAMTELLEEKEFSDITVNELCDRAMIRRTTFYKHFADKNEYLVAYLQELRRRFIEGRGDAATLGLREYILDLCRQFLAFVAQHHAIVEHGTRGNMISGFMDLFQEILREDLAEQLHRREPACPRPELEAKACFYAGGIVYSVRTYLLQKTPPTEQELLDALGQLLPE